MDEIIKRIMSGDIGMIACDEIHKNVSSSSLQGKCLAEIKNKTGNTAMWIPITGTPIVNKPTDGYMPLKLIGGHNYKNFYLWCQTFCVYGGYGDHQIVAYKNIPTLKSMLQDNMIRRLKDEVLDLPPKIHITEYVENTNYQQKLYDKVLNQILVDDDGEVRKFNPVTKLLGLRQVNGAPELIDTNLEINDDYLNKNSKLCRLLELLDEAIEERGEKVVIFSNWVEPLKTLYHFISKKYKTCCFIGSMSSELREKHKKVFMTNPEYKVLLGTIGAAGTSNTFTVANTVIFYDEPWTPADKVQGEDRVHRIGTTKSTTIITLMTKGTVDERVHDILYQKEGISNFIVDNRLDFDHNPSLFYDILGLKKEDLLA
jgi:SNF2 family DNA or RNA helicase